MFKPYSYTSLAQNIEQGPTIVIDRNLSAHTVPGRFPNGSYGSNTMSLFEREKKDTIRFQVVIWSIENPDVTRSRVTMKFRVTLFWNTINVDKSTRKYSADSGAEEKSAGNEEASTFSTKSSLSNFEMEGREKAKHTPLEHSSEYIDVPALSIINAESFATVGSPDITCLREVDGLMRWTCLYKATLRQNDMMVTNFPHDRHSLCIQLGILKDRHPGATWDRRKWKLSLATADDSRGSTRIPHGNVVDNVRIPEFTIEENGTSFEFAPVPYGPSTKLDNSKEECLEVKVKVYQESGYYDKNVIPVFVIIAVCSMFIIGCVDATNFFQRALMLLNSAFLEVGLRMNIDDRLPRVRHQIKLQRVINCFFFLIFYLVMQSGFVHVLHKNGYWSMQSANIFDGVVVFIIFCFILRFTTAYYWTGKREEKRAFETV